MDYCFRKLSGPVIAAGAFALLVGFASQPIAYAQAATAATGQQPAAKNYKDKDEYDLFLKVTQTPDPKARLQLLNTWQDKYPGSDYAPERLQYFVDTLRQMAPKGDTATRQMLITKCEEQLKADPNNFLANYWIIVWGPVVGGSSPTAEIMSDVDGAAKAVISGADGFFIDKNKPAAMSSADWAKQKIPAVALAHNDLAWEALAKKDNATAESEYRESLKTNPEQGTTSVSLGKLLVESKDNKQIPEGLFEYARAGEYTGPGPAVAADARTTLLTYFNKAYKDFHGTSDGAQKILDDAKTMALPPDGFTISTAQDKANADAASLQKRIDSDPAFKIWYAVESQLTADGGNAYFSNSVSGYELPGGTEATKYFNGIVISADPSKVVLGVQDPAVPDATLLFTTPLKETEASKIKVGDKLQFTGIAESFVKDPYMLTFKDPSIPGVETSAPAKTGKKKK